jgi:hypothetical protein
VKRITIVLFAIGAAALPSLATAQVRCGNEPSKDVYDIAGPSCSNAKAVANTFERGLLTPGVDAKHNITVDGGRCHITFNYHAASGQINGTPYTQIELYRAVSRRHVVTWRTYGAD